MRETKLLGYLINRLKEEGIIRYNKDFLDYIDAKDLVTPKQLSGYLKRDGEIRNKQFVKKILDYFDIAKNICQLSPKMQISLIEEAIKKELKKLSKTNDNAFNLTSLIPLEHPCTKEQLDLLEEFKKLDNKDEELKFISNISKQGHLDKTIENQEFLVGLLKRAYDKGLYKVVIETIIPKLFRNYHNLTEVQKIEAHSLGSLNDYKSAQNILSILIDKNVVENINLRTSALSNKKRELLDKKIDKESLYSLVKGYQELFEYHHIYSYYTGINLLYLVILGQVLFPDDSRFSSIDTQSIYQLSKPSLKEDKTHNEYYVYMSELEFKLLLCRDGVIDKIESFLANYEPHPSLVERTFRQMKIVLRHIQKKDHIYVKLLTKATKILQDYILFK